MLRRCYLEPLSGDLAALEHGRRQSGQPGRDRILVATTSYNSVLLPERGVNILDAGVSALGLIYLVIRPVPGPRRARGAASELVRRCVSSGGGCGR
jgi:hypothetical protein